jgi:tetratricopeptide (TPR) repeat protein
MPGEQDEWFVRKFDTQETIRFERLGTLQQWIGSNRVQRNDLLSRGDDVWKRLGDISEMQPFFEVAGERVSRSSGGDAVSAGYAQSVPTDADTSAQSSNSRMPGGLGGKTTLSPPPMVGRSSVPPPSPVLSAPIVSMAKTTSNHPASPAPSSKSRRDPELDFSSMPKEVNPEQWHQGKAPDLGDPAWTERESSVSVRPEVMSGFPPPRKRSLGGWFVLGVILLLTGGGLYLGLFGTGTLAGLANRFLSNPTESRYQQFYSRGRESFLLDSEVPHYRQADIEFQKVLALNEKHEPTIAALAELHATWAQSVRDTEVDVAADLAPTGGTADSRKVDWLRREFELRLSEASRWADQAKLVAPDLPETRRAVAEVLRLRGKFDEASAVLAKGAGQGDPETRYVRAMVSLDEGNPPESLLPEMDAILAEAPLLRLLYRKARVLASLGREQEARETLNRLFELNPDHLHGRDLLSRLEAKLPVYLKPGDSQQERQGEDAKAIEQNPVQGESPPDKDTAKASPKDGPAPTQKPDSGRKTPLKGGGNSPRKRAASSSGDEVALRGGNPDTLLAQAAALQRGGRCADAIPLFELVLELSPTHLDAMCGMAACHRERGSLGQAIALYRRALGVNPVYGPALYGLADSFKAQGQNDQATKYYRQYLSSNPNGRQAEAARRAIESLSAQPTAPASSQEPSEEASKPAPSEPHPRNDGETGE